MLAAVLGAANPALPSAAPRATVPAEALASLRWRQLGPYRAGWATSVAGVPGQPHVFWFGTAGGGMWKTNDAGNTWQPFLQHESASAIGAIAIAPSDPTVVYAGTGQEGSRYDVLPGDGVFRSTDGGLTWTHAGLRDSRHIGALLVHPADPRRVLAAAIGHAFGPNAERGVFLTTDGGEHWRPVLQPGDSVGAVDLAWDETEPRTVFATTWQRRLRPWFDYWVPQGGPGSALWRSDDGGEHWTRLRGGFPGEPLGRIGVAVARGTAGRVVYAAVEAATARRGPAAGSAAGLWRSGDRGETWARVSADASLGSSYFGRLTVSPRDSDEVFVMGQSIRRSSDGGRHFEVWRGSPGGDDYHQLWIDPADPAMMIAGSDQGAAVSVNGGATWSSWYNQPTGQFYHLGADDRFPYRVYSGQQDNGTVEISSRGPYGSIEDRDWHPVGGAERDDMLPMPGRPDVVMGSGLGGGVSRFDELTRQSAQVAPWPLNSYAARPGTTRYRFGWITPLAVSPVAPHATYLGGQVLFRTLDDGDHWDVVSPDLTGARAGAGDCGDPSLPGARECGCGVISAIAPSPLDAKRIWVGSDDGLIHLTTDGGAHWRDVTPPAIPDWGIVFTIDASPADTAVAYAAVDLHRLDRHEPLLLRTRDSGRSWATIVTGLPSDEFTSVIRVDPLQPKLLYAGTNRAVYVSFDDGGAWQPLDTGLPATWMRDLLPHQGDLLLATQGRGLWALDDVAPLRELAEGAAREDVHLFTPSVATRMRASESHDTPWPPETPLGENPPTGAVFDWWLRSPVRDVTLTVRDSLGRVLRVFSSRDTTESTPAPYFEPAWVGLAPHVDAGAGAHRFVWDLRTARAPSISSRWSIAAIRREGTPLEPRGALVPPGRYTVTLVAGGRAIVRDLVVRMDPRLTIGPEALLAQWNLTLQSDSSRVRALAGFREVDAVRRERAASLPSALADSLGVLADRGAPSFAGLAGELASVSSALQSADAAPTQGAREALASCERQLEGLLARWSHLRAALPPR